MLQRREFVKQLLVERGDLLVVCGLGSPTYDVAAANDGGSNFYLWGAMGSASMVGLGLALARPDRRVAVFTGDGEMLMGLGSLATIGVKQPPISLSSCSITSTMARPACSRATRTRASAFSISRSAVVSGKRAASRRRRRRRLRGKCCIRGRDRCSFTPTSARRTSSKCCPSAMGSSSCATSRSGCAPAATSSSPRDEYRPILCPRAGAR